MVRRIKGQKRNQGTNAKAGRSKQVARDASAGKAPRTKAAARRVRQGRG